MTLHRPLIQGISLLELMLAVAVIALLLIVATRYFLSVQNSQRIQSALSMVKVVRSAAATFAQGQANYANVSMDMLNRSNLLPRDIVGNTGTVGQGVNPWGGDIRITPSSPGGSTPNSAIEITLTQVPGIACVQLKNALMPQAYTVTPCNDPTVPPGDFAVGFL